MRKIKCTVLFMVALLLTCSIAVYADIIVEPNNSFYERHRTECVYLNRSFYANSKEGFVSITKEPGSKTVTTAVENGETIYIKFTYNFNGEQWGITEIETPQKNYTEWPAGWIPMEQLLPIYDYISFEEDHGSEIYDYTGDSEALASAPEIVFWPWPGSGSITHTLERPVGYEGPFDYTDAYKDNEGREWVFLTYWVGNRNVWVCVDDPANRNIPAFNPPPEVVLWPSVTPPSIGREVSALLLITVLVGVLVVGTVILVRICWKPKKEN